MPLYRIILKKAWKISLKNKWLWFLGFFAAFLSNESIYESIIGGFSGRFQGKDVVFLTKDFLGVGLFDIFQWSFLKSWWTSGGITFTFLLLVTIAFVCLLLFFVFLSIISQAGLIKSAIAIDVKEKYSLKRALQDGIEKFWSVLALNVITKVILFGALVIVAYLFSLLMKANPVNFIDYILFVIFIAVLVFGALIIYYLTIYGTAFIMLRGKKVFNSLRLSWHIFVKNILINLEMALILFVFVILATILYLIVLFVLGTPLVLLYMLLGFAAAEKGVIIVAALAVLLFIIVTVFFGAWYSTFQITCWTLLFEELVLKKGRSKFLRIIDAIFGRGKRKKLKKGQIKKIARKTVKKGKRSLRR